MAAMDRRNPNLDDFVGLNWSCWVDRVKILSSDAGSNAEDSRKNGSNSSDTMTLRKEDMHIYGHCPAHDDVYLVVCSHCGQVVKPQAFEAHCQRWHGPLTNMCSQSSTVAPQQRPHPGRPPSTPSSARERQKNSKYHEASASSSATPPVCQQKPTKAHQEAASVPLMEKFPPENPSFPSHPSSSSSTSHHRNPLGHSGPLRRGSCSSSTSLIEQSSQATVGQSRDPPRPERGARTYKNTEKKECDLNKQHRVPDPERKKLCSQEPICNPQKAVGRTKTFDQLAAEQTTSSAGRDTGPLPLKSKGKARDLEAFEEKTTNQGSKYNFNSNCHTLRSRDPSGSFPEEEEGDSTVEVKVQPPYPFNQSLVSSEESEEDEQEEGAYRPAASWHPKPLGLCTFGCRTLGCSIFTFDRRWHHLRFALSAMFEHHVSRHLWKKMPQVSSGHMSPHVTPPAVGSSVKTGARNSKSTSSFSLESTSMEQLEAKSGLHNTHGTKLPSSANSASRGPGQRQRNPFGRSSKAQVTEVELMQDASVARKAAKLPRRSEDRHPNYIKTSLLHDKGQPNVPSSQGPVNIVSQGKKPCPPLHRSSRSRGKPPGIQQEVIGYDHKGLAQKRKGSKKSPPLSSSLSRNFKCQRFSSSFTPATSPGGERVPGNCLFGP